MRTPLERPVNVLYEGFAYLYLWKFDRGEYVDNVRWLHEVLNGSWWALALIYD